MNATKNNQDARETYKARANDIARLLDVLQMELDKHANAANADARNWGHAGDLGKVRSDLIDLVGFLSGNDRENIESFLAD